MTKRSDSLIPRWPDEYSVEQGVERIGDIELRWTANLNLDFQSTDITELAEKGWDDAEPFIDGWVKFDGCYHLHVGERGYLHLCGNRMFDEMTLVLARVQELASKYTEVANDERKG
jgi:hypothetical protein